MGQWWDIYNIDREQQSDVGGAMLGEFFFDDCQSLLSVLRIPILPSEVTTWLEHGNRVRQPGPFGKLSVELVDMIISNIPDLKDLVDFMTTAKFALDIGQKHLLRLLREYHAPWAGGRLICLGGNTREHELPQGLLTEDEKRKIAACEHEGVASCLSGDEKPHFRLVASETYPRWYGPVSLAYHQRWDYFYMLSGLRKEAKEDIARGLPDAKHKALEIEMFHKLYVFTEPTYPTGPLVLCNLSKAEYVREDRLTVTKRAPAANGWDTHFNLMHALLSRICWSPDDSISMSCGKEYKKQLVEGPWAGDRFCVVTVETMPRPLNAANEWKDVTEEIDLLLNHLWEENEC